MSKVLSDGSQVKSAPPLADVPNREDERVVMDRAHLRSLVVRDEKLNVPVIPDSSPTDEEIEKVLAELCCKKCFGRGYIGWTLNNDPILCDCVRKREPLPRV